MALYKYLAAILGLDIRLTMVVVNFYIWRGLAFHDDARALFKYPVTALRLLNSDSLPPGSTPVLPLMIRHHDGGPNDGVVERIDLFDNSVYVMKEEVSHSVSTRHVQFLHGKGDRRWCAASVIFRDCRPV